MAVTTCWQTGGTHPTGMLSCFTDVSSGEEEDAPEPVEQDEETRELRIIDPNAYVSLFVKRESFGAVNVTSQDYFTGYILCACHTQ